jgi:multidrug efflux pump
MNLSGPFVRRPVATILLTIGIALAGIGAFFELPVSPLPQVDFPTVSVRASLPGASPETMATSVATPLERRLGVIADVSEMTSRSALGSTNITLQFNLDRNIDGAARDVQAAINGARADLPATLRQNPTYRKQNPADAPIMILALTSETRTPGQIYDAVSNTIQQRLLQVKGVGDIELGGGSLPAVRVELNPHALNHYGVSAETVRSALSSANANRPKGVLDAGPRRFQVYTNDQGLHAADYTHLVVAYRGGSPVRLSDVASVIDSVEDIHTLGLFNAKPAVVVIVSRQPGANIISTVDLIKQQLPLLRETLPADIKIDVASDRTTTIRASLHEVELTLLISTLLVIGVVALFLGISRATLIPATAVVVSLLGTLGIMYLLGFSLDNLSLMALTVATGFVVDDAIVVLENITRHIEQGVPRFKAALMGAREVGFTVLSISLSLVAVFIPLLFMGGIVGRLFREFAVTLSTAILISLVISLTTTPMLSAYLANPKEGGGGGGRLGRFTDKVFGHIQRVYGRSLGWSLDNGPLVLFILAATVAMNIYLFTIVPKGFFPEQDTGQLNGGLRADQSISFQEMKVKLSQFVTILKNDPAVSTVVGFTGGSRAGGGFVFLTLKDHIKGGSPAVIQRLRPKLAKVSGASLFLNPVQDLRIGGRSSNSTYQYTLKSDDLTLLRTWATKLANEMKKQDALTDVDTDQEEHGLESFVTVDRDAAARLGISNTEVDNALYGLFGQRQVSTIYNELNQYHVVMEADPQYAQTPAALNEVYVATGASVPATTGTASSAATPGSSLASAALLSTGETVTGSTASVPGAQLPTGGPAAPPTRGASASPAISNAQERLVPLSAIATFAPSSAATSISHQDQSAATTISFNLAPGASLSDAQAQIKDAEDAIGMPATVRGSFQGTAKVFQQSLANEPVLIVAAILAIYIVLGILYESFIHPITVLSTLPSAGVGAVLALLVFKVEFSIIALIGVILLIGIVKKNAILIIDFALEAERARGLSTRDAIFEACMLRLRPILMTTMAAMLGAVPLAVGLGAGAELRRPLGITIIGGLLVSQLLTLITTPVIYLYMDRFRRRSPREAQLSRAGGPPAPEPAA